MNNNSDTSGFGSADWLVNAVKKNPEGLLLLAAGCALLMRTGSGRGRRSPSTHGEQRRDTERGGRSGSQWEMPEGVSRVADTAREYASELGKTVSETVSAAGEYAKEARQTVVDQSGRIAEQTQNTVERIVRLGVRSSCASARPLKNATAARAISPAATNRQDQCVAMP